MARLFLFSNHEGCLYSAGEAGSPESEAVDGRATRHIGYRLSQRFRKTLEEIFGWVKGFGGFQRTRFKGVQRTRVSAWFVGAAYNWLPMVKLMPQLARAGVMGRKIAFVPVLLVHPDHRLNQISTYFTLKYLFTKSFF